LDKTAIKGFNKLCLSTLVAVYILILVGSVVRSTGSGMGCPDWPRCFGSWVPPSSVSQLPGNYKEIYAASRIKKNVKFIGMLKAIGMSETASKLESDKTVLMEEDFSVLKSRIEYINRIVGVVIGMMISLVLLRSFKFFKTSIKIFVAALVAWLSVVFTGWFGSIVVSTNLTPWTVSVHLGFAMLIVGLLVYIVYATSTRQAELGSVSTVLVVACFSLTLIQMVFGVQVREALDQVAFTFAHSREEWISKLGSEFIIHRSFSWLVMLLNGWLSYKLVKISGNSLLSTGLAALTLGSILTGIGMAYLAVPAFLQPLHLLISALTFGTLLMILFRTLESKLDLKNA
jgi:cytochrome c oxidase assembly protein subunit 15